MTTLLILHIFIYQSGVSLVSTGSQISSQWLFYQQCAIVFLGIKQGVQVEIHICRILISKIWHKSLFKDTCVTFGHCCLGEWCGPWASSLTLLYHKVQQVLKRNNWSAFVRNSCLKCKIFEDVFNMTTLWLSGLV